MSATSNLQTSSDKRSDPRAAIQAVVTFFPFSSQQTFHCDATALNAGQNGLYFESPFPLKEGQYICIRTREVLPDADSAKIRTLTLAQVRWCAETGRSQGFRYGVGVKYC